MPIPILIKKCSKCLETKETSLFNKAKTGIYGVRGDCKLCQSKLESIYRFKNKEIIKIKSKLNSNNIKPYQLEYRKKNIDNRRNYINKRLKNDINFKLSVNIRNLIRKSFTCNGYSKTSKSKEILGCSFEEFKSYLESKFETWMNWTNRGNWNGIPTEINTAWDIDHIIPLSSAKTEEEIIKLNHYSNLQPLCSYVNRFIKKNKLI